MKKGFVQISVLLIVSVFMILLLVGRAKATQGQVCFCHDVTHNPHTICTDNEGLINGHTAHVKEGFDTLGACTQATVTQLPSITVTPTKCLKPTVTPGITITSIPTVTASVTATLTPTVSQNGTQTGGAGDGKSDGRHDGNSSCQFDKNCHVPVAPPATGRGE